MRVTQVEHIKNFELKVKFYNGKSKTIDFKNFLKKAVNPMTSKYYNVNRFKKVKIEHGYLSWGNNEMDLSGESLYNWEKYSD